MAEPGDGGEIIIKGGSVEVVYNGSIYTQDPGNSRKHQNPSGKITQIVITDDRDSVVYDSGENQGGLKWKITAFCK